MICSSCTLPTSFKLKHKAVSREVVLQKRTPQCRLVLWVERIWRWLIKVHDLEQREKRRHKFICLCCFPLQLYVTGTPNGCIHWITIKSILPKSTNVFSSLRTIFKGKTLNVRLHVKWHINPTLRLHTSNFFQHLFKSYCSLLAHALPGIMNNLPNVYWSCLTLCS